MDRATVTQGQALGNGGGWGVDVGLAESNGVHGGCRDLIRVRDDDGFLDFLGHCGRMINGDDDERRTNK